jgi:hypothetical protein
MFLWHIPVTLDASAALGYSATKSPIKAKLLYCLRSRKPVVFDHAFSHVWVQFDCVAMIFCPSYPFKVADTVILLVTVLVVYLRFVIGIRDTKASATSLCTFTLLLLLP